MPYHTIQLMMMPLHSLNFYLFLSPTPLVSLRVHINSHTYIHLYMFIYLFTWIYLSFLFYYLFIYIRCLSDALRRFSKEEQPYTMYNSTVLSWFVLFCMYKFYFCVTAVRFSFVRSFVYYDMPVATFTWILFKRWQNKQHLFWFLW